MVSVSATGLTTKTVSLAEADDDVPAGPVVRRATADAHVRDGAANADTNYGAAFELELKQASVGYSREAWLKFDLTGVTTVTSGKLRLFGRINSTTESVGVAVYSSTDASWTEPGLTFNTRPASGATAHATKTVAGTTDAWYEWDLTSFLQAELAAGRTEVSLVLRPLAATGATVDFASDEAPTNRPELVLTE